MALTPDQARRFYDRFGRAQDLRAFYEDHAVGDMLAHGRLDEARAVFEFGCGTGRLEIVSLTRGATASSRLTSRAWTTVWSRAPGLVGGCRPVSTLPLPGGWHVQHRAVVTARALTSEVVVASRFCYEKPGCPR